MSTLNTAALSDRLARVGLSQADVARELDVSREAVSKWFSGESVPQPDRLLRLGMLLEMSYEGLVETRVADAPVVRYRRKAARRTRPEDVSRAQRRGDLLRRLAPDLPGRRLAVAPTLRQPRTTYEYVQAVASDLRREMGLEHKERIEYSDLIGKFGDLDAVIVPVLWGAQDEHGNALHVYLPDSATAWVFLNLDSNAVDFNFWMAHELGHCLTPSIGGEDEAERFADAFAQGFLYPEAAVVRIRPGLRRLESVGSRVNRIRDEAKDRLISPWTIRKAVRDYEVAQRLAPTDLGEDGGFAGATRNFAKGYKAMAEAVFKTQPPTPGDWVAASTKLFRTPFFGALASFCRRESGAEHFIHELLGLPLPDAKALAEELRG